MPGGHEAASSSLVSPTFVVANKKSPEGDFLLLSLLGSCAHATSAFAHTARKLKIWVLATQCFVACVTAISGFLRAFSADVTNSGHNSIVILTIVVFPAIISQVRQFYSKLKNLSSL